MEGEWPGTVDLQAAGVPQSITFSRFLMIFSYSILRCYSGGHFLHTFHDFGVPRASKIDACWVHFDHCFVIG